MAILNDLRTILGATFDFHTNDLVTGTGGADTINIYGGNDTVQALGGNDVIFDVRSWTGGSSGVDTVMAGDGDDLIVTSLDTAGNIYAGDAGTDTINFIPNGNGVLLDLATNIARDRATLATSTVLFIENAVGTAWTDLMFGDAAANKFVGYNGDDLLRGFGGNDELFGDRGRDVLFGGLGDDMLIGGIDADILYGEVGSDTLNGEAGTDILVGGLGKDVLIGGLSSDRFEFRALKDSGLTIATTDKIMDFTHLVDRIDVSAIDANAMLGGNQAFTFRGTSSFNGAGQIRYTLDAANQDVVIQFNTDSDAQAEMIIRLDTLVALSAADFIL